MTTEYSALRQEIRVAAEHQRAMVQLGTTIFVGILTLVGLVSRAEGATQEGIGNVLLLAPLVYVVLSFTTADAADRISTLAGYLHDDLRPRLESVLGGTPVWRWELYVRAHYSQSYPGGRWLVVVMDQTRWVIFLIPSVVAIAGFYTFVGGLSSLHIAVTVLDVLLLLLAFAVLVTRGRASGPAP